MTNTEFINLIRELNISNPHVRDYTKRQFLQIIKNSAEACESAKLLFKDKRLYDQRNFDDFIKRFVKYTTENIKRAKAKAKIKNLKK